MGDNRKIRELPLITQEKMLLRAFPNSIVKRGKFRLWWQGKLKPTALSSEYSIAVKLEYGKVETFVIEPQKLALFEGETSLPHVYSTSKQKLCLFFPDGKEWSKGKLLVDTIIPWTCEWLYFYEIWVLTGAWLGGGTKHETEKIKINSK